jgi:flagellar assembly protein FliH
LANIRPFTFGSEFDTSVAPKPVKPPEPTFSKAELEAARQAGIADGRAAATAEAQQAREQRATAALSQIAKEMGELRARNTLTSLASEQFAISVAELLLGKALPELAKRNGHLEILAFFQTCLQEARCEPRLVVRVSETVVEVLRPLLEQATAQSGFEGKIVILPEAGLGAADCRIEWADGGGERDMTELLRKSGEAFDRFLDRASPAAANSAEGPAAGPNGTT